MHIAIDDTYGPDKDTGSTYVTGKRRTHVALVFQDSEVNYVCAQIKECLAQVRESLGIVAPEFHFVDLYNRKGPWANLADDANLRILAFFAEIYQEYRWPVFVQTVDSRTLQDHGIKKLVGKIDGLDLSNDADLSLYMTLIKIKRKYIDYPEPLKLYMDEGRYSAGHTFGSAIFDEWPDKYEGIYASSAKEPLLQLADFVAFCINRSTHLSTKPKRSPVDNWFIRLVAGMQIKSDDVKFATLQKAFTVKEFDDFHRQDRIGKGLESSED